MATRNLPGQFSLRGGASAALTRTNPVLKAREIGVETDTNRLKIGDGSASWGSLPYVGAQSIDVTLSAASWSSAAYTVSNSTIKATSIGFVVLQNTATAAQYDAYASANPMVTSTAAGSIIIKAYGTVPTVNIPISIIIF